MSTRVAKFEAVAFCPSDERDEVIGRELSASSLAWLNEQLGIRANEPYSAVVKAYIAGDPDDDDGHEQKLFVCAWLALRVPAAPPDRQWPLPRGIERVGELLYPDGDVDDWEFTSEEEEDLEPARRRRQRP